MLASDPSVIKGIAEMDEVEQDEAAALDANDLKTIEMEQAELKPGDRVLHDEFDSIGIWRVGTVESIEHK